MANLGWLEERNRAYYEKMRQIAEDIVIDEELPPEEEAALPQCPWHGEFLDDDGGCCLCFEQVGDDFAYKDAGLA